MAVGFSVPHLHYTCLNNFHFNRDPNVKETVGFVMKKDIQKVDNATIILNKVMAEKLGIVYLYTSPTFKMQYTSSWEQSNDLTLWLSEDTEDEHGSERAMP